VARSHRPALHSGQKICSPAAHALRCGQFCKRWSLQLRGGTPRQKLFDSRYRMFGDAGTGAERAAQLFAAERLSHDMPRCQSVARHDVTEVARCKTT
jgi:hypothetical protein